MKYPKPIPIDTKFGNWKTLGVWDYIGNRTLELCECSCGVKQFVNRSDLRGGKSKSCRRCGSANNGTHRLYGTPTYHTWSNMLARCRNENNKDYHHYGGRGITVCFDWLTFEGFLKDMGIRPAGLELDRIDNNGNYEVRNCRWTTHSINMQNTYRSKINRYVA